jgi:hypothetical protein
MPRAAGKAGIFLLQPYQGFGLGAPLVPASGMNWMTWLGLAVLFTAIAAVTGIKPKGTRHVTRSRMLGMGRVFLVLIVAIFAYMAYRARSGG